MDDRLWTLTDLRASGEDGGIPRPDVVIFDLDDTLAESKAPVPAAMLDRLLALLEHVPVCIISGARFEQFQAQLLDRITAAHNQLAELHIMPTCGTRYYKHVDGGWVCIYAEDLSAVEKAEIIDVLRRGAKELGLDESQTWGDVIEDRSSQITFSALGQQAPVAAKAAWDPTGAKRDAFRRYAAPLLPDLEVRAGGSTSIDVTRKGIDKGHGVTKLSEQLAVGLARMLFVGDRLEDGGNDYPVRALGVRCIATTGPAQTAEIIDHLLARL